MKAYEHFEFHIAYQALNDFINTDLSDIYLDVLKDRLYTFTPSSVARRSGQTALWRIAETLARLIAPVLSFTADEVWDLLPFLPERKPSVHLARFSKMSDLIPRAQPLLLEKWGILLGLRQQVFQELEGLRKDKLIGKGLQATVVIDADGLLGDLLEEFAKSLPEFFSVSVVQRARQLSLSALEVFEQSAVEIFVPVRMSGVLTSLLCRVLVTRSHDSKCERCWRYIPEVGADPDYPTVCLRCAEALHVLSFPPYPAPPSASGAEEAAQ